MESCKRFGFTYSVLNVQIDTATSMGWKTVNRSTVLFVRFLITRRARRSDKLCRSAVGTTFQWLRTMSFTLTVSSADEHDVNNRSKRRLCSLSKLFSIKLNNFKFMAQKCMLLEIQSIECFMHQINLNACSRSSRFFYIQQFHIEYVTQLLAHFYFLESTSCN